MKLITLNIWGGKIREPLEGFLKANRHVDVFCFQEAYKDGTDFFKDRYSDKNREVFYDLQALLPEHAGYFHPALKQFYGPAMFIRKGVEVISVGDVFIHKDRDYLPEEDWGLHGRNMQHASLSFNGKGLTVANVHGLWNGQGKFDSDDRLAQSAKICDFIKTVGGPVVLCGDFNLRPDTKSVAMIESLGLRNLITEYKVTSTRTSIYSKDEKYADYIFTSPQVKVVDFRVMPDEVSDHSPLLLEFSI